ncbi:MAG: UDP-N-acetylmuramate--L-alanine ligase [Lachnospiraceae bacterium]|nr:UDP-N-acetylmuramate--L-alanine ligase [Lachnospiraceae bacterium]
MYQIDFQKPVHVYFVGIGGISMSGLAEILRDRGFKVSGSDRSASPLTERLAGEGITVHIGQRAENITEDIDLAVFTAAIHPDNPEYVRIMELGIPSLTRAQLLGQIMKNYEIPVAISGTHGKTTTTSMLSEMLLEAGQDPTLSIGGNLASIGGNVRIGQGSCFVAEACEYTNSFLSLFPKIAIILNIDADHLDFFKDLDDIRASFARFAALLPEDGTLIINGSIPDLDQITKGLSCRIITFGNSPEYDYYADEIHYDEKGHPVFRIRSGKAVEGDDLQISLGVPGEHNIYNAVAAVAAADLLGISRRDAAAGLAHFGGAGRRFQSMGTLNGAAVIDDYAHHPTEIAATLRAASKLPHDRIICVFQSHTFSRTKALMHEFAEALTLADLPILADIYPARETDNLGISAETLRDEIRALGHECLYFPSFEEIENFLRSNCQKGDLLITMGAGNIDTVAKDLVSDGQEA